MIYGLKSHFPLYMYIVVKPWIFNTVNIYLDLVIELESHVLVQGSQISTQ